MAASSTIGRDARALVAGLLMGGTLMGARPLACSLAAYPWRGQAAAATFALREAWREAFPSASERAVRPSMSSGAGSEPIVDSYLGMWCSPSNWGPRPPPPACPFEMAPMRGVPWLMEPRPPILDDQRGNPLWVTCTRFQQGWAVALVEVGADGKIDTDDDRTVVCAGLNRGRLP